jgi:hypothetical protein
MFSGHTAQVHFLKLYNEELYSCSEDGTFGIWDVVKWEKRFVTRAGDINFLKKVIPMNDFYVYAVGAGPFLYKISKFSGKIEEAMPVGSSFINDFDLYECPGEAKGDKSPLRSCFALLGGECHSVLLKQYPGSFKWEN